MRRSGSRIGVVVADDHPVFREGIAGAVKERPELRLLAEAGEGREALERIQELEPAVAILDLRLPGLSGLEVLRAIQRSDVSTAVLLLSAFTDSELAYEAAAGGARGYLTKDATREEVCDAVVAIARGGTVLAPEVQTALTGEVARREREDVELSEREGEVLVLLAEGLSAPQMAERLHLGTATVKTHLQGLYAKLEVSDRGAAVAEAMRRGMIT